MTPTPLPPDADAQAAQVLARWMAIVAIAACAVALLLAMPSLQLVSPRLRQTAFWTLFAEEEPTGSAVGLLLLAAGFACASRAPSRLLAAIDAVGRRPWPLIVGFAVCAAAAAWFVYAAYPLCMDEYAPWFQARAFAAGKLTGRVPPAFIPWIVPSYSGWFLDIARDGRIVSAYWPGFALLLTPFTLLRVPWLLNPLIGATSLFFLWRLARKILPQRSWGWVLLLAVASPVFLVDAISFYAMSAHLLFNLIFADLLIDAPSARRTALAGAVGSFALSLHNPVPHALFALPWIAWIASRPRSRHLLALALGYVPLTLVLVVGWALVRADVQAASPGGHAALPLWEVAQEFYRSAFSIPDRAVLVARVAGLTKLVLWGTPGLLAIAAFGADQALRRKAPDPLRLFAWSALLTIAAYFFFPQDQGHGWGYRYFHSAWGALPLLAALPLLSAGREHLERIVLWTAMASLLVAVPLRLAQVRSFIHRHLAQIPAAPDARREVVFVRPDRGFYSLDLVENDPFLRGRRLTLFSHGDAADADFASRLHPKPTLAVNGDVASVWIVP